MQAKNQGASSTAAALSEIDSLSPAKLELLARLLNERRSPAQPLPGGSIPRRSETAAPAPLSFAQERLLFMNALAPDNPAFNLSGAIRASRALNLAAYAQVMTEIVRRHQILRTTFPVEDGGRVQVVSSPSPASAPIVDLRGLAEDLRGEEARRIASLERRRG